MVRISNLNSKNWRNVSIRGIISNIPLLFVVWSYNKYNCALVVHASSQNTPQDLIYELPGTEFHTLKFLIQHLYNVAQQQDLNKMSSGNIG